MPTLKMTAQEMHIHLSVWEKLIALHGDIHVPVGQIRGATEDSGFRGSELGLRIPGTNIPGLVSAGTFRKSKYRQFVFVSRGKVPVVIELKDQKWDRIVFGASDPRDVVNLITKAIARAKDLTC